MRSIPNVPVLAAVVLLAAAGCSVQSETSPETEIVQPGPTPVTKGSETCAHSLCAPGKPLAPSCSKCVAAVCAVNSACCKDEWKPECIELAGKLCNARCPGTCDRQEDCNPFGSKCCATPDRTAGYCEAPGEGCPGDVHWPLP